MGCGEGCRAFAFRVRVSTRVSIRVSSLRLSVASSSLLSFFLTVCVESAVEPLDLWCDRSFNYGVLSALEYAVSRNLTRFGFDCTQLGSPTAHISHTQTQGVSHLFLSAY